MQAISEPAMTLIQFSISAFRRVGAVAARAGLALLRLWCIPVLGAGDAADFRRDHATYHI
jgi:hypothetical protein